MLLHDQRVGEVLLKLLQRLVVLMKLLKRAEVGRKGQTSEAAVQGRGHGSGVAVEVRRRRKCRRSCDGVVGEDVGDHEAGGS